MENEKESSLNSIEKGNNVTTVLSIGDRELKENDLDRAFKYIDDVQEIELDPEVESKLDRKIDWLILPIIGLLMSMQLMDKTTNSYASIMGLFDDIPAFNGNLYLVCTFLQPKSLIWFILFDQPLASSSY